MKLGLLVIVLNKDLKGITSRKWRNWYTRASQKRMAKALRVRVSPSAFLSSKSGLAQPLILKILNGMFDISLHISPVNSGSRSNFMKDVFYILPNPF